MVKLFYLYENWEFYLTILSLQLIKVFKETCSKLQVIFVQKSTEKSHGNWPSSICKQDWYWFRSIQYTVLRWCISSTPVSLLSVCWPHQFDHSRYSFHFTDCSLPSRLYSSYQWLPIPHPHRPSSLHRHLQATTACWRLSNYSGGWWERGTNGDGRLPHVDVWTLASEQDQAERWGKRQGTRHCTKWQGSL